MALDIRKILDNPGVVSFEETFNWEPSEVIGATAWNSLPYAKGTVTHKPSGFSLAATLSICGQFTCDHCGATFRQAGIFPLAAVLTDELEDTDNPDYYLITSGELDISEILRSEYVLQEPTTILCPTCDE
ncbi:MAG: hypothetical protein LBN97_02350 [Oscillospiraceae bacterium]|jgi:hypothetical protein|nr:hypothetical protein [Oscillospiraceae bacterium]